MSSTPLCFFTIEYTAKIDSVLALPDIIKTAFLTRTRQTTSDAKQAKESSYLYELEEQLWNTNQDIADEAYKFHNISMHDLRNKPKIHGLKLRNKIFVCWSNVFLFKVLKHNKVKYNNESVIYLNTLLKVISNDGHFLSLVDWTHKISEEKGLSLPKEFITDPRNKAICLSIVYDYIAESIKETYLVDVNRDYELLAMIHYIAAKKASQNKKMKSYVLITEMLEKFRNNLADGQIFKELRREVKTNYLELLS